MKKIASLVLPATLENLTTFMDASSHVASTAHVDPEKAFNIELALEEVLVNIINYAYEDGDGEIQIVFATDKRGWFVMEITDKGKPFDMTKVPPPDMTSTIEDRQVGGLGIHFMKTLADEIDYRRESDSNILELRFSPVITDV
jgi:serine/threonine-protein kinase RsbW